MARGFDQGLSFLKIIFGTQAYAAGKKGLSG
jgi:hypothetical protein